MSAGKPGNASTSEAPANGQTELAEQATEGMLGPNPFVGLRAEDIVASTHFSWIVSRDSRYG